MITKTKSKYARPNYKFSILDNTNSDIHYQGIHYTDIVGIAADISSNALHSAVIFFLLLYFFTVYNATGDRCLIQIYCRLRCY